MIDIALTVEPDTVTLVPERREEVTTERGLLLDELAERVSPFIHDFKQKGIEVSLFIDPENSFVDAAVRLGVEKVEFHTGTFANARDAAEEKKTIEQLKKAVHYAKEVGLRVAVGHGLNYENVKAVAQLLYIEELNIGHSIVARALFVGMKKAVEEMCQQIQ